MSKTKKSVVWLMMLLCCLLMGGCSTGGTANQTGDTTTEGRQTEDVQSADDKTEDMQSENTEEQTSDKDAQTQSAGITEQEALAAALSHAGVEEGNVTRKQIEREYENGREIYDVEFYADGKEYDYEVDAATGEIISWEADRDD